ncbi:hypothetical protein AB5N19_12728 [Seiridium cardinale]|uniref:protein-tyrosine-phosphatase n=1 Tax=Seiridium cardinale TaxID=138064 RepID=A0ABR2Y0K2_9PEZI
MPSAAARRLYEDQLPSFMSIIDSEVDHLVDGSDVVTMVDSKFLEMEPTCAPHYSGPNQTPQQLQQHLHSLPTDPLHRHHDSTSTQNSAESSPTTTLTTDTSSLSDPSPSSSPDSPVNLIPLNNYPGTSFGGLSSTMNTLTVNESPTINDHFQRPMTSPSPRRRNMKGLSIQPPFAASLSTSLVSEPSSPSFIKPQIPTMKRKPSQLSLKTDGHGLNIIRPSTIEVPPSPAMPPILQRRALKHSTSSPHMLSGMKSATFGPAGGMTFPTLSERGQSGLSEFLRPSRMATTSNNRASIILEEDSPIRSQQASCAAMDFEPFRDESEANEDQKSPGYPDGPVAIYEDNVYLYLEPSAEEAAKFDVVINVAREVLNPFGKSDAQKESAPEPIPESPIPDTAVTSDSFSTAFEYPTDRQETPTTPKAANPLREPEYIHMPWDHNTDIATDLMMLCETIEKRTKEGKKVLVHCQQGASRSASLIIAYGLYQNPGISVNDAYYTAQTKSRWISPNMKLMYCLQDFQKEVAKRKMPRSAAIGPRSGRSPTKHRLTLSADAVDIKPKEPLSAPLPDESPKEAEARSPERSPQHARGKSTPNLEAISPGPSSAPSSFSWGRKEEKKDLGKNGDDLFQQSRTQPSLLEPESESTFPPPSSSFFKPPPSPGLKPPKTSLGFAQPPKLGWKNIPSLGFQPPPSPGFAPPRPQFKPPPSPGFGAHRFGNGPSSLGFSSLNFGSMDSPFDQRMEEPTENPVQITRALPDDDALMSPRAETMTSNPLHDSFGEMAGMKFVEVPPTPSEGLFSPRQTLFPRDPFQPFGRPPQVKDPRSPPTKGETPIVRSIDELL